MDIEWHSLQLIGSGCYSAVFRSGEIAIKIGLALPVMYYEKGVDIPYEISEILDEEIYLNRNLQFRSNNIFGSKADVLIMPLGWLPSSSSEIPSEDWLEIQELRKKVKEKCKDLGIVWEDSLSNIVKWQERWYAIDFGDYCR